MTTSDEQQPAQQGYRSGEAARLAKMPVTTLRIWERRYGVVGPAKTASGQRLYTEEDVRRLSLIKLLVSRGHAIGAIARLDREQLQFLATRGARENGGAADPAAVGTCSKGSFAHLARRSRLVGLRGGVSAEQLVARELPERRLLLALEREGLPVVRRGKPSR